jgi:hypothetical protein
MLFIFGIGPRSKVIEEMPFVCPVCQTPTSYQIKQHRSYFSLFFIPLFPVSKAKLGFKECLNCHTKMPNHF